MLWLRLSICNEVCNADDLSTTLSAIVQLYRLLRVQAGGCDHFLTALLMLKSRLYPSCLHGWPSMWVLVQCRSSKLWAFCKGFDRAFPMLENQESVFNIQIWMSQSRSQFSIQGISQSLLEPLCLGYVEHFPLCRAPGWFWWKSNDISPHWVFRSVYSDKGFYKGNGVLRHLPCANWQDQVISKGQCGNLVLPHCGICSGGIHSDLFLGCRMDWSDNTGHPCLILTLIVIGSAWSFFNSRWVLALPDEVSPDHMLR